MANTHGYILIAKQIESSDLWIRKTPEWRLIWLHLLLTVNYQNNHPAKGFRRGEGFFSWSDSKQQLRGVGEHQWQKCIMWCRKEGMIETQKRSRGLVIRVMKYRDYQTPAQYNKTADAEAVPPPPTLPATPPPATDYPADFLALWDPWPRHRAKTEALAEYKKALKRATHEKILAGHGRALTAVKSGEIEDPKYLPELFRWLKKNRWDDEYQVKVPAGAKPPPAAPQGRKAIIEELLERMDEAEAIDGDPDRVLYSARDKYRDQPRNSKGETIVEETKRQWEANLAWRKSRQGNTNAA